MSTHFTVDPIESAVAAIAAGRPVVVLDAPDRENEGDLIMAAQHATPEWVGFFVRYGSGLLCAPITDDRADRLGLPTMVTRNQDSLRTNYTVTIDAAEGVTTGISATDRSRALRLLAGDATRADDFVRPGHVLPLRARSGGVRERAGHTEATIDLCRLAGVAEAGVIVELVHDNGEMRRGLDCRAFADEHGLPLITIEDLRTYVAQTLPLARDTSGSVSVGAVASLPTVHGDFAAHAFVAGDGVEHIALVYGDVTTRKPVLTRMHSECLTGDVFGSMRCDCGPQLNMSLQRIVENGSGIVVYLRGHEGRGIGLAAKVAAYHLQEQGLDTVDANTHLGYPADARDYRVAASILGHLGVEQVELLTNNPHKVSSLIDAGIDVAARRAAYVAAVPDNVQYLTTKVNRMGHLMPIDEFAKTTGGR